MATIGGYCQVLSVDRDVNMRYLVDSTLNNHLALSVPIERKPAMDLWDYEMAVGRYEKAQRWLQEGGYSEFQAFRDLMRLTLRDLAAKLAVDHTYVYRIERGEVVPSALYVGRFLRLVDRWTMTQDPDYIAAILGGMGDPSTDRKGGDRDS